LKYQEFLKSKEFKFEAVGFEVDREKLNKNLFEYQKDILIWALRKGRSALFEDCGLGKTLQQLEWANKVARHTGGKVLILTPLAVAKQTVREGIKFGIDVNLCRSQKDVKEGINITNYEMLHKFDTKEFTGIVLDESSILKSFSGKIRNEIIGSFKNTPYKLACTATPAPNDYMELGNHAEFLGVMSRTEMLAMYFVHDGGDTSKWRLKGHAEDKFWQWISSWAVVLRNPSDLGYDDDKFKLPKLRIKQITVDSGVDDGALIPLVANTMSERREARKASLNNRIKAAAELVNNSNKQWLVWCDFNYESEGLTKTINEAVEVKGADKPEYKENSMLDFADGSIKALITKPSIAGFGMNWQNCSNMIFCGLSDSYEQFYQAVRRCWRFGQEKEVNVYVVVGAKEVATINNIKRKSRDTDNMQENMVQYTRDIIKDNIKTTREITKYNPKMDMVLPKWIGGIVNG
jgi:superfamily II DNA or RNA helicase